MARFRGGSRPVQSQRRKTEWTEGPGSSTVTTFTASTAIILGFGILLEAGGITLVRLRGSFQAYITSQDSIDSGFHCALGVGVASQDAFAVGVTAVPNPIADMDWPGWLYHRFFDVHGASSTVANSWGANGLGVAQFEVDSKAMRKVGINEVIFATVETVEDAASGMSVWFDSRTLFKLP